MEVVVSLSQGRTAAVQCGLFTHKSVPVIFEPPCIMIVCWWFLDHMRCYFIILYKKMQIMKIFQLIDVESH